MPAVRGKVFESFNDDTYDVDNEIDDVKDGIDKDNDDDDDDNDDINDDDDDDDYIDDDDTFHHQSGLPVLIVLIGPSCWQTILADLSLITMMTMIMIMAMMINKPIPFVMILFGLLL